MQIILHRLHQVIALRMVIGNLVQHLANNFVLTLPPAQIRVVCSV